MAHFFKKNNGFICAEEDWGEEGEWEWDDEGGGDDEQEEEIIPAKKSLAPTPPPPPTPSVNGKTNGNAAR